MTWRGLVLYARPPINTCHVAQYFLSQTTIIDILSMSTRPSMISVFMGFLGSGKTTVILSLLRQLPSDYKVVLLKNEFGDVEGAS